MRGAWLEKAIAHLEKGGLAAYPTETLWGLGVDARSDAAIAALRAWKGERAAKPFSVLVASRASLGALGVTLSPAAEELAESFWPGPLTLVLPSSTTFAAGVARDDGALGVRCSPHPVASALAAALEEHGVGPLTATSLNRSGDVPAATREAALVVCDGSPGAPELFAPQDGEATGMAASSVIDLTGTRPELLRAGANAESLRAWVAAR